VLANTCERCGGAVRVIACIEDLVVIKKILVGMQSKQGNRQQKSIITIPVRAPPAERISD
jgi:hypothetical protein